MRRAWMMAPLALLAACIDFVEVTAPPPEPRPASATVTLQVGDRTRLHAGDSLFAVGYASAGRADDGTPRAFADDVLHVAGVPVAPEPRPDSSRAYFVRLPLPDPVRAGGPLEVRMPTVAGVDPPPTFRLYLARPLDDDTLRIAAGQDLVLRFLTAAADATQPSQASWNLLLLGDGGAHVALGASGPLPATVRVPATWLPAPGPNGLRVELSAQQHALAGDGGAPYQAAVSLVQDFSWTVLVAP